MNKDIKNNSLKKKDIIVMFINLLVLLLVIYVYFIVAHLKTKFSNESNLCLLESSSNIDQPKSGKNDIYVDESKMINRDVKYIRYTRSLDSKKFKNPSLFTLAQPNIDFEQNGILGPWILSNKSLSVDTYFPLKLTSRRTIFEIIDEGLYLINIQVYYLSSSKRNSFAVIKITANTNETLSVCSAVGAYGTELSCFTSIVEHFNVGESILIRLREMTSSISLSRKASHTYLGFTKLL